MQSPRFSLRTLLLLTSAVALIIFAVCNVELSPFLVAGAVLAFAAAVARKDRGFPPIWRAMVVGYVSFTLMFIAAVYIDAMYTNDEESVELLLPILFIAPIAVGPLIGIPVGLVCGFLVAAVREVRAMFDELRATRGKSQQSPDANG